MKKLFLASLIGFGSLAATAQKAYTPQDEGSKVHFVLKNMGINVGGDVTGLKGKIVFDAKKLRTSSFDVTVDVSTIDTDNERRDGHLQKEDFFDAAKYPFIQIKSSSIAPGADMKNFIFKGDVTMHGVTKPIEFPFTAGGRDGGAEFEGTFEINRNDFGVGKSGGTMGDNVTVELKIFAK